MDVLLALGLSLLTVLSRLPFRARVLYNWDAVQFALAIREFDVAKHQPHPPGYFLYVLLGRLLDSILNDPKRPKQIRYADSWFLGEATQGESEDRNAT